MLPQNYMENFHTNSENERKKQKKGLNLVLLPRVSQNVMRQPQEVKRDPETIGLLIKISLQTMRNFHKF